MRVHYDSLSPLYRVLWGEHLHHGFFRHGREKPRAAQVELLKHCSSMVDVQPGWRVLDVGCGYGATMVYLAQRYGCRCTGITISGVQSRYARRAARSAGVENLVALVVGDAEAQDLGNSYDLVWIMESAEHFSERAMFFRRAAAALVRNGKLLLSCWAAREQSAQLRELAALCACPTFQSVDNYLDQITASGLRVQRAEELTSSVARTWDVVQRRALFLMPTARLWPAAVQRFAVAVPGLRQSFHSRDLQYWVAVAEKP